MTPPLPWFLATVHFHTLLLLHHEVLELQYTGFPVIETKLLALILGQQFGHCW